jgi:hypothetical protein
MTLLQMLNRQALFKIRRLLINSLYQAQVLIVYSHYNLNISISINIDCIRDNKRFYSDDYILPHPEKHISERRIILSNNLLSTPTYA